MELSEYIEEIKLAITGEVLTMDISDDTLGKVVMKALREIQRFIDETRLMTIPFASCIDLSGTEKKISSISRIYRTEGYTGDQETGGIKSDVDPMYAQMWMAFTNGGTMYNLNDYVLNYLSYNTLLQMRNTTSTDLSFKQDLQANKLYINTLDKPAMITIEYIPKFENVNEVKSDYWIDILSRLSIAMTKVTLGRIRTRYTSSSSLWQQDGETILAEGTEELNTLRETLRANSQIIYPID